MAERKAVNKYYPPDWDPRKGSVNKRVGQHPLRDRAKKLSQGILVIRFELPYNIWCGGCGSHVGMGVRYNAEKSKVGNYYSTPIYKFRMKCHLCDNYFEIQTDPKNHDYVILNGARRKEQRWDPVANGQIMPEDKATQKKLATDPMYKLEHGSDDHQKGKESVVTLEQLEEGRISMIDDYLLNRMARDKFRSEKRQMREADEADKAILDKSSLDLDLVEESEEDRKLAGLLKYSVTTSFEDKQKERRKSIEQRPLFGKSKVHTDSSSKLSSTSSLSLSSKVSDLPSSLSDRLPYQRHVNPVLSRRGEIKQKLGWAIKASYKDPFKSTAKESGKKSLASPTNALQRQLGIKLKPSAQSEQSQDCVSPTVEQGEADTSSSSSAVCSVENHPAAALHPKNKNLCSSNSTELEDSKVNAHSGAACHTDTKESFSRESEKGIRDHSQSDRQSSHTPCLDGEHSPTISSLQTSGEHSKSSIVDHELSSNSVVSPDTSKSGLGTLMSSYGGSDSDSSD